MAHSITNELKEYLFHLNYKQYSENDIFKLLFFSSLYSFCHYGRGNFCTDQGGTKEEDIKKEIKDFILNPSNFEDIKKNIDKKFHDKNCYYISTSDLISLNFSLNKFNTEDFNLFFKKYPEFEFEDTFDILKKFDDEDLKIFQLNRKQFISLIDYFIYNLNIKKEWKSFLNKVN